jgi:dTDP-4-dehydrorhamnose reductase
MRALVFGVTGQVARELRRRCPDGVEMTALARETADLTDPASCADAIMAHPCDVVINAAAYTAVDRAETEEDLATLINGKAPTAMAQAAATQRLPFLHVSTDYVFDGSGDRPWREDDSVAPLNAYGRSKLAGEAGVIAAGGEYAILRTSWVFSAHGNNFVKTMLRLSQTHDQLRVVEDQIGGPTAAADIADALWQMATAFYAGKGRAGIYHFSGAPDTSWKCFARETFVEAGATVDVVGIPSQDYPTPALRPGNSRLNCTKIESVFGISRPDWQRSLADVVRDIQKEMT